MLLIVITFITALSVSGVAIYYSVAGLMTIFSASAISIMIMGSVLEISKLVAATWLHRYWNECVWWIKTYLIGAIVILMFITSMGIFGYLSKAHIEQSSGAAAITQNINRLNEEELRLNTLIKRSELAIETAKTDTISNVDSIQNQIDREQARIDNAFARVQPEIDRQIEIIKTLESNSERSRLETQINQIESNLSNLELAIAANEVRTVQSIVGVEQDGDLGPGTERAIQAFKTIKNEEKTTLLERLNSATSVSDTPAIKEANEEIKRLRAIAENEITNSNALIANLRNQLTENNSNDISGFVEEQNKQIETARNEMISINDERFKYETELRLLEAEIGPLKYIAEFVYGEADKNVLEEAVRWVILIIIIVFDPLAVILLIASQHSYNTYKNTTPKKPVVKRKINRNEVFDITNVDVFDNKVSSSNAKQHLVRKYKKVKKNNGNS